MNSVSAYLCHFYAGNYILFLTQTNCFKLNRLWVYLTEVFIDDLKFSSIAKILRGTDEHEDGHSVFTDSCRLTSERATGTEYNRVSTD